MPVMPKVMEVEDNVVTVVTREGPPAGVRYTCTFADPPAGERFVPVRVSDVASVSIPT